MPQIMTFYARMLAIIAIALVFAVNTPGVVAQKPPKPDKQPAPQPEPDPRMDAFKAARKNYEAARKEDSRAGMKVAIDKMAETNLPDAAKYLLKELMEDQRERKAGKPGLPGNTRKDIILGLAKFSDEESVRMIGEGALSLNSNPKKKGDERLALDQFDFFFALARMQDNKAADAIMRAAISEPENPYVKVAAIEAARQAIARRFVPEILAVLAEPNEEWAKVWTIVPINVFACLETLIEPGDTKLMLTAVEATAGYEERMEAQKLKSDERVRFFGGRMLRRLTGEIADMASVSFWKWWVVQFKALGKVPKENKPEAKRSKTVAAPPIFDAAPVGKRFVFVIDVSKSMELPLKITLEEIEKKRKDREGSPVTGRGEHPKPPEKKEGDPNGTPPANGDVPKPAEPAPAEPPKADKQGEPNVVPEKAEKEEDNPLRKLPWESISTKLELAREELSRGIKSLAVVPEKDSKQKIDREFAIVIYSTEVKCLTGGWVLATPDNCDKWAAEARKLEAEHLTNIHGGLMKALRISSKGDSAAEPSVDKDCVMTGADSIIFLTDGWASWDDQSTSQNVKDPRGGDGMVGDGPFILGDKIWPEIVRQNVFRKIVINTVGIGNHDKQLLRTLARETGGTYVDWGFKE